MGSAAFIPADMKQGVHEGGLGMYSTRPIGHCCDLPALPAGITQGQAHMGLPSAPGVLGSLSRGGAGFLRYGQQFARQRFPLRARPFHDERPL